MAYRVTCTPDLRIPATYGTTRTYDETARSRCLRLPPDIDRKKIADYATSVLAAAGLTPDSPAEPIAHALEEHLARTFRYSLDSKHEEGAERVAEFLFVTKEGHCEVFASALAVLLRAVNVPSRIVDGFKGGEYHAWSESYSVKERNAHSWVEALTDTGWMAVDATPDIELGDESLTGIAATIEDAREWLEIRWFRDIIAFDPADQVSLVKWAKAAVEPNLENFNSWRVAGRELLEPSGRRDLGLLGGVLAMILVLGTAAATVGPRVLLGLMTGAVTRFIYRLVGVAPREEAKSSRELDALVAALEARGVRRQRGETARELALRAADVLGECARPVEAIVPFYYEARFGGRELRPEERALIASAVKSVSEAPRS